MLVFDFSTPGSIGPLCFGMPRGQVRALLGETVHTFKKTSFSVNTTDAFHQADLHAYYDVNDGLKGVEFFEGSKFLWQGNALIGKTYADLKKYLLLKQAVFSPDDCGVDAHELGLGFYIPDFSDEGDSAIVKCIYLDLSVVDSTGGGSL
ncbi:hypothetical protein BFW87_22520 [Pseudomonas fluorescens]|uniref:Uncharacterized protein n=1 Tax=Pseudomonas fluorescens TaxID=294 RepID=A0A1T2YCK8_PSEFL|nr:hypothetical protein [Pseudomonas fluorescens]OPA89842.1 hypothetical protein BFW87_22520 [Pseudomonas fluorescens]